ncbi:CidA/LrgA family protein [uncultured Clostridium sp.]|jgi:holin-like protein|uniref:CidA/LrgA family protein n=1 Tax=uncultured Clostridium sp. TaxID=59620 RepID=UPI0026356D36|nr:CidA/LrgA family protein [uncultured Clostridium sp.]
MKLLREMLLILVIYFVGDFLSKGLHLPIPGNILGMIILLILLCTKIVKVENVDNVSTFLLDHLAFLFIPAGVGVLNAMNVLDGYIIQLLIIVITSTMVIMAVTGTIVQSVMKLMDKKKNKKQEGGAINE